MLSRFLNRTIFSKARHLGQLGPGLPRSAMGTSHKERTAAEPRDESLHTVILSRGEEVTPSIRLLRLSVQDQIKFLPGQWVDTHIPGLEKAGGFTITSPPSKGQLQEVSLNVPKQTAEPEPYLELAIQKSPNNPAAAWLWQAFPDILSKKLQVRVGGSFIWPPSGLDIHSLKRIVFIAGGVGINPLISILSHLAEAEEVPFYISFIYSFRHPDISRDAKALFEDRLLKIFDKENVTGQLVIHRTSGGGQADDTLESRMSEKVVYRDRRIGEEDILKALGPLADRGSTVCYICGVPTMTDQFVEVAVSAEGMSKDRVLFERWW